MIKSISELAKKYRDANGGSARAAAPILGVSVAVFCEWLNGEDLPSETRVVTMAGLLGEHEYHCICTLRAERAKTPELREIWARIAKVTVRAMGIAAMSIGAASFGGFNNNAFANPSGRVGGN